MPTKYKGSTKEVRALNAYICLQRASESITSRINKNFKQDELTLAQFSLLECLYHHGSMNPTSLASKTMRSCGNLTFVLDKLEGKGCLKRQVNPKERRSYTIVLLDKGKEVVEKWLPVYVQTIVKEMELLNPKELEDLRNMSKIIGYGSEEGKDD